MNRSAPRPQLDRRSFLRLLGFGAAAGVSGGLAASCATGKATEKNGSSAGGSPPGSDRATAAAVPPAAVGGHSLVVIELEGGNDGLSTLVPFGLGRYHDLRPGLAFEGDDLVRLDGEYGLHPGLAPLAARGLAVVQGVGVAKPDLSHFAMLRRWWEGDPDGKGAFPSGFLGRCCDQLGADAPLVGVSLGSGSTPALRAERAATAVLPDPAALDLLGGGEPRRDRLRDALGLMAQGERAGDDAAKGLAKGPAKAQLGAARKGLRDALEFGRLLAELPEAPEGYPNTGLGAQLALASRIIRGGWGVRVIHVPWGGFDTHSGQRGAHDQLITELGAAGGAFLADLAAAGKGGEVLLATTSEFGRRAEANETGTDHGTASCMLLAGPVHPGRHGEAPSLDRLDDEGNLVATVDLADYYATLCEGWLGVPAAETLGRRAQPLAGVLL